MLVQIMENLKYSFRNIILPLAFFWIFSALDNPATISE